MRVVSIRVLVGLLLALLAFAMRAEAATGDVVLVVANARHPWSVRVATHYLQARGIPASQLLTVDVSPDAIVSHEVYQQAIERPLTSWLRTNEAFDRTHIIVLGPGMPLRIGGTNGRNGTGASVDSEVAVLYRRLTGSPVPLAGFIANPYFSAGPLVAPRPFDRAKYDIYLVTRIDGRTEAEALALIGRGAVRPSTFVLAIDGRPEALSGPEARWLAEVGPRVQAVRPEARVVSDASTDTLSDVSGVTGYASWGSNDVRARVPPVTFGPGALASSFMSSDARTMAAPPANWQPAVWSETASYFAGSPEALAADWLAAGLTGLAGQVAEPYLDGAVRPATLHEAWVRGYTLAESFYLAMPYLSWQAVVFGDPLARALDDPGGDDALTDASAGQGSFVDRAATVYRRGQPDLDQEAATLMARADLSIARGDMPEARKLLEEVTVRAPGYTPAQLRLAQQYDADKLHDLARARYEAVLQAQPANAVALNNLAYNLGVHGGDPKGGLVHAERAAALAGGSAAVLDTLGWLRHLAGDSRGAVAPLRRAVDLEPELCEAWRHLALAQRATGDERGAVKTDARAASCGADVKQP
jgi:uncharacterized protein (TIGR03790 family)